MARNEAQARIDFAKWVKLNHPTLFAKAVQVAASNTNTVGGLGGVTDFFKSFGASVVGLGTTYLALKNQRDAMKINLQRAQEGLPPIDVRTSAPAITTNVELSPELTKQLVSTAGTGINKTLMVVGAGILAFILAKKFL